MFSDEELKVIKSCLLTTKETFKLLPFKRENIKNKIKEIDNLLEKIDIFLSYLN